MKWQRGAAVAAVVVLGVLGPAATAGAQSEHSDNVSWIANWNNGADYQGSDQAFWGNRLVLGQYGGPGGFQLMDIADPAHPRPQGLFNCPGTQADVSIWHDLVIVSVDSPRGAGNGPDGKPRKPEECGAPGAQPNENQAGTAWEGLRIVSIADPAKPVQLATVKTDCGSHTHTLVPDPEHGRLIAYVLSYPLGAPQSNCNAASHRKISIVEIPLASPQSAKVIGTASVSPNIGCHDVTVFLPRKIAGAACISESQIWDISDPAKPKVIAEIKNSENNIHHSSAFSWDGKTMVLGDEFGGAEEPAARGCNGDPGRFAGLWFYDVSDPANPVEKGFFKIPQTLPKSGLCTAHEFNVVPLRSDRDVLVSGWYEGGLTVVDFTDPSKPRQLGYYIPRDPVPGATDPNPVIWSAYWYNGHIYANNLAARGMDVFTLRDPLVSDEIPLDHLNPQVQEPLPPPAATPGAAAAIKLPKATRCTKRSRFRLRLRAPRGAKLRSALIYVGGRRAKVVRGRALRRAVRLRGLPRGRKVRIDVTLRTKTGRRISRSRTYRFC